MVVEYVMDCVIKEIIHSGKSRRKFDIKKNISNQRRRQNQLSTQLRKVYMKPNLVILKAMINRIKSLKKLIGRKAKIKTLQEINASRIMAIWLLMTNQNQLLEKLTTINFLTLSSPGTVAPCLKNNHSKVLLLGLPSRCFAMH